MKGNSAAMEQVNNIELNDPDIFPDDDVLRSVLGKRFAFYAELIDMVITLGLEPEWKYYKDGKAWLCKVQYKKRTIIWMSAWKSYIKATVYFAEKYAGKIMDSELPEGIKSKLSDIKNVGKSIPLSFDLCNKKAIKDLDKTIKLKMLLK